jgi:ABC-type nitrate/sulfonate/bicarbonate transport system substrate-binding protein
MQTIRVGMVAPAVVFLPLWVADQAGEFACRGIRVDCRVAGTTDGTTTALLNYEVDVAFATPDADRPPLSMISQPGCRRSRV